MGAYGELSPPTSLIPMDTPLSPPFDFWDETMKRKRGERRREEEEEKNGHDPPLHFRARFATV